MKKPAPAIEPDSSLYGPARGRSMPDSTPVDLPLGYKEPESIQQMVARLIQSEKLKALALESGQETFEESEDFGPDEDVDPATVYEQTFDPMLGRHVSVDQFARHQEVYKEMYRQGVARDLAEEEQHELLRRLRESTRSNASGGPKRAPDNPPDEGSQD